MLLPPAVAGALPGVMPLAEPLLGEHRTVSVHLISSRRLPFPNKTPPDSANGRRRRCRESCRLQRSCAASSGR